MKIRFFDKKCNKSNHTCVGNPLKEVTPEIENFKFLQKSKFFGNANGTNEVTPPPPPPNKFDPRARGNFFYKKRHSFSPLRKKNPTLGVLGPPPKPPPSTFFLQKQMFFLSHGGVVLHCLSGLVSKGAGPGKIKMYLPHLAPSRGRRCKVSFKGGPI